MLSKNEMPGTVQKWTLVAPVKKTFLKTTDGLEWAGCNMIWPAWALVWSQQCCLFFSPVELYWIATINRYFNMGCVTFWSLCVSIVSQQQYFVAQCVISYIDNVLIRKVCVFVFLLPTSQWYSQSAQIVPSYSTIQGCTETYTVKGKKVIRLNQNLYLTSWKLILFQDFNFKKKCSCSVDHRASSALYNMSYWKCQ
jgi:hypothetical protein